MALKNKVLFLECTFKKDERKEGKILREFLKLVYWDKLKLENITTKRDFFKILNENNFKYIHISCHGVCDNKDNYFMQLPFARIYPSDFDIKSGLRKRYCFISACSLGKVNFSKDFRKNTGLNILIAPQRGIDFAESALFWVLFYYYHFNLMKNLKSSFNNAKKSVKYTGAMKYFE